MNKIKRTIIFGNIFVAACAYFLSIEESYFAGKRALINTPSLFVFFSTLLIYNYRKLFFNDRNLVPPLTQRVEWVVRNRSTLAVICFASLFGIMICAFSLSGRTFLFLLPLFLVSVLYATPFSRNMNSVKRLRYLPFLKIFLIAGVWSAVTVLFPVIENTSESLFSGPVIFTFITRFIFIFSITVPFDIRDIEVDKRNNIKTFPVVLGERTSVQIAIAALLLFILMYAGSIFFIPEINQRVVYGYIISGFISIAFVAQSLKNKSDYFISFWIEGLMLMQFLLILLVTLLF